ncbi:hypothetical protein AB9F41_18925 [Rhizobium leguminosarum]|uniref:hypothetical protein n=1 Tax=Rhizobium leguminosarum TaxID=384 RepID=UPI003F9B1A94
MGKRQLEIRRRSKSNRVGPNVPQHRLLQAIVIDPSNDIGFHAGNANRIASHSIEGDQNERTPKRFWIENMNDDEPNISTTSNSFHERGDNSFFADLSRLSAIELGIFKKVGVPVKEHSFATTAAILITRFRNKPDVVFDDSLNLARRPAVGHLAFDWEEQNEDFRMGLF